MFVNGDLKGKFIMDRNLGAREKKFAPEGKGSLYYQNGRKDPFAGGSSTSDTSTIAYEGRGEQNWIINASPAPVFIDVSVAYPLVFYTQAKEGSWASAVDSEVYVWNDFETNVANSNKSIFDPSPKGWKVPHIDTWSNFSPDTMNAWDSNAATMGRSYPLDGDNSAYYPAQGLRIQSTGIVSQFTTRTGCWSSTPSSTKQSYSVRILSDLIVNYQGSGRAAGFNVRPVQHDE